MTERYKDLDDVYFGSTASPASEERSARRRRPPRKKRRAVRISDVAASSKKKVSKPKRLSLADRVKIMEDALKDMAENGTRHDLNPTIVFTDKYAVNSAYTSYIRRMDDHVRSAAKTALSECGLIHEEHE